MKANIKDILLRLGVLGLSRWKTRHLPRILVYHNFCGPNAVGEDSISPDVFRLHLRYLAEHYRVERLEDLARKLGEGVRFTLPTIAITIDDGHLNFKQWGYPLLK